MSEVGEIRWLRRVGLRTRGLTVAVSTIAGVVSIVLVNLLRPGAGVDPALAQAMLANAGPGAHAILARTGEVPSGIEAVLAIVPSNVVGAIAGNDLLAVMFFALFFGTGIVLTPARPAVQTLKRAIEGVFTGPQRDTNIPNHLAPHT